MGYVKTVCLDFDGVMNTYDGWKGEDELFEPKEGIKEFLDELKKEFGNIFIHTTRDDLKVTMWLMKHGFEDYGIQVWNKKPPAILYIDDRGLKFNGDFKETLEQIKDFKAYWE
jgi:hypothetical protein